MLQMRSPRGSRFAATRSASAIRWRQSLTALFPDLSSSWKAAASLRQVRAARHRPVAHGRVPAPRRCAEDICSYRGRISVRRRRSATSAPSARYITFGIRPAGTGKTYCHGHGCAQRKEVIASSSRARGGSGEPGFLPGTLTEKVDPHIRPLYDAVRHDRHGRATHPVERRIEIARSRSCAGAL
ncbi:MAG: PhoH family protein [Eggerthellaceae bacterium]